MYYYQAWEGVWEGALRLHDQKQTIYSVSDFDNAMLRQGDVAKIDLIKWTALTCKIQFLSRIIRLFMSSFQMKSQWECNNSITLLPSPLVGTALIDFSC